MNNVQNETVITFELTLNETNVVIAALRELPHRVVADLLNKVIAQAQKQTQTQVSPNSTPVN